MRKVSVARCAFFLLMLSMFAASGADTTVTNKELGFEIVFPQKWSVQNDPSSAPVPTATIDHAAQGTRMVYGAKQHAIVEVKVFTLKEGTSLRAFVDTQIDGKKEATEKYELLERSESPHGDAVACKVAYVYDSGQNATVLGKCVDTYLISGNRGYKVRTWALKDDYDKYAIDFDAIVKSFKLIDTK